MSRKRKLVGKRHSPEQIVRKLRQADAMLSARKSAGRSDPARNCWQEARNFEEMWNSPAAGAK